MFDAWAEIEALEAERVERRVALTLALEAHAYALAEVRRSEVRLVAAIRGAESARSVAERVGVVVVQAARLVEMNNEDRNSTRRL